MLFRYGGLSSNDLVSARYYKFEPWKSSGEPESWAAVHLNGWNHQDWLDLLASLRRSRYWPLDESAIGEHLETLRARMVKEKHDCHGADSRRNLSRWQSSREPETWVRAHSNGWNHQDWLDLLASLRTSQYWPIEEAAIGQHLEELRAKMEIGGSCGTTLHKWHTASVRAAE